MANTILFYDEKEPYYEFSNFFPAKIKINGREYQSSEYYYQAQKFMGPDATPTDLAYAKLITQASTPNKAYYLAKQVVRGGRASTWYLFKDDKRLLNDLIMQSNTDDVKMRTDWDGIRDNVMRKAVWAKFIQHPKLRKLLTDTKDARLAENSPRDSYWGIGVDKNGENMLGRILMEVRTFLTGKFPTAPTTQSNWVVPEFVLASAYPIDTKDSKKHANIVDALVNAPIDIILSLQEPHEDERAQIGFNSYRKLIFPKFKAQAPTFCEKKWSARYARPIILMRIPIKDQSVLSDAYLNEVTNVLCKVVGKHMPILIHCLAGKGRTGTVIAVMLGKMYGMSADKALKVLKESFANRIQKGIGKQGMPQTMVQFEQVQRMLKQPLKKLIVKIIPSVFKKLGTVGDYAWMIKQPEYNDALFIFNDNVASHTTSKRGIGNAVIRPFNKYGAHKEYPRSAGISTGFSTKGGYKALSTKVKEQIDAEISEIRELIKEHEYKRIFWSSTDSLGTDLGTGIFIVDPKVKSYIVEHIKRLGKPIMPEYKPTVPTVICIKKAILKERSYADLQTWLDASPNHVYIGRNMSFYVPGATTSKWENPYPLKKYSLDEALNLYEKHLQSTPELVAALPELTGKVLGCWCDESGHHCHGDVLVKLYKKLVLKKKPNPKQ